MALLKKEKPGENMEVTIKIIGMLSGRYVSMME